MQMLQHVVVVLSMHRFDHEGGITPKLGGLLGMVTACL
jgi:hypothetical protein